MQEIITRKDAKRRKLKRYFNGSPCPNDHISERYLSSGACVECNRARGKGRKYKPRLRENSEIKPDDVVFETPTGRGTEEVSPGLAPKIERSTPKPLIGGDMVTVVKQPVTCDTTDPENIEITIKISR